MLSCGQGEWFSLVGLAILPTMANGLPYSFLPKHNTKLRSEFVLWAQLLRGAGFWL
jgi:hypothetical protein